VDKKYNLPASRQATKSFEQTQKIGEKFAKEIRQPADKTGLQKQAVVLALQGELGGGKTTFLQGFAKGLSIKEKILSPTFVILKHFKIQSASRRTKFTDFYHIDCYRIKNKKDILELGFAEIISNPKNIVAIEWPEKIKKALPKNTIEIKFKFVDKNKREINFKM